MNKFSKVLKGEVKINKEETELKYDGTYLKVVGYNQSEFVKEDDVVVILPYLVDEASILMRSEYVATYQYFYKNYNEYKHITNFLTIISGTVKTGESLKNTVRRELYEEAGVVLSSMYDFDIEKSMFMTKGNVSRYHVCILELRYNDFKVTTPPTDGTKSEKLSKTLKIGLGDLDELRTHDLITEYMLTKFKLEYIPKK